MKKFKTWIPEYNETRETAKEMPAYYDADAAERRAEELFFDSDDPFEEIEIFVEDVDTKVVQSFVVCVDFDPTFSAYEND